MCPMVRRKSTIEIPSTFGKMEQETIVFVATSRLTPADKANIVPVEELPDAMIQDLSHRFPREFGPELSRRKLPRFDEVNEITLEEDAEDPEELDELQPWQVAFAGQNAANAIEQVKQTEDVGQLEGFREGEEEREGGPRKTVIEAIDARVAEILEAK